jgi:adenosylcobinamide kinase/adenosylcobinamide-phosphate guanylyltransferase
MRALVVGGSGSGKSAFAEHLACSLSTERTYVATMRAQGAEAHARIARHRLQRAHLGFATVAWDGCAKAPCMSDDIDAAAYAETRWGSRPSTQASSVMLLDDLGNLAANALFGNADTMADPQETLERLSVELDALCAAFAHAVVVGNEAGCDHVPPQDEGTRAWIWLQGALCCHLAALVPLVVEVVAGLPVYVKGEPIT